MSKTVWGLLYEKEGESPERIEVKNELLSFQRLIGGYIEAVSLPEWGGAVVVCDEGESSKGSRLCVCSKEKTDERLIFLRGAFSCALTKEGSLPT